MEEIKERHRQMWASGDYPSVAEKIAAVGQDIVQAAEVVAGQDVLDVAAGAGNASIPAAVAGANVTASDLTPELFDVGRAKAAAAGVEVEWVQADAEDLPFEDASFDRVLSTFGAMFAPRHQQTADELARVCRPGGVVAMANWTPEGTVGTMFRTLSPHMPPPPDFASPPPLWGMEDHVREVFEPHGLDLSFERRMARFRDESAESYVDFMEVSFGPMMTARAGAGDSWPEVREQLIEVFRAAEVEDDAAPFAAEAEYLLVLGRKPGG